MATLIAFADGNLTGAATFDAAETGSLALNLVRNTTASLATASSVTSASFTVTNAKVIDAVLLWLNTSGTVGTGTFKVDLQKGGVSQASVTVNKSDLPDSTNAIPVPVLFKLTSTATGDGGANWTIVLTTTSGTGSATITYNINAAGATNFTRALRTTTAATPAAADDLYIVGELTGAATHNSRVVTMDSTATTTYGNGSVNTTTVNGGGCHISCYGTFAYGIATGTNYYFKISGDVIAYWNGTYSEGSSGAEIPRDSTAVLEFLMVSAAGDFGVRFLDNCIAKGAGLSRTVGKNVVQCKLTANVAASGTTWNVDTDTGWLNTDVVCTPSTSKTVSEHQSLTLSGNAGASSFVSTVGASAAHLGTSPTQGEVGLITRNVIIRSTSSTLTTYVYCRALASVAFSWVEMKNVGANIANKKGLEIESAATATAKSFTFCSIHDIAIFGVFITSNGVAANLTFTDNIIYNNPSGGQAMLTVGTVTAADWTISRNMAIGNPNQRGFILNDLSGVFSNNTAASVNQGINLTGGTTIGTFSGNTCHSNDSSGLQLGTSFAAGAIADLTIWHTNGTGLFINNGATHDLFWTNLVVFGSTTTNISAVCDYLNIVGGTICATSTFPVNHGIIASSIEYNISSVDFVGSGIQVAHSIADLTASAAQHVRGVANNCKFGAGIVKTFWTSISYLGCERYGQTAGDHRTEMAYGTIKTDSVIYNSGSPSTRMTPTSASKKLESAPKKRPGFLIAVNNGDTVNVSAFIRKSSAGDGTAYTGSQPRLIQRANAALGQNNDVVLATYSVGTGSQTKLSGTSSVATDDGAWEFIVDCDGTVGWINVDDWAQVP